MNPYMEHSYDGIDLNPFEAIFVKVGLIEDSPISLIGFISIVLINILFLLVSASLSPPYLIWILEGRSNHNSVLYMRLGTSEGSKRFVLVSVCALSTKY